MKSLITFMTLAFFSGHLFANDNLIKMSLGILSPNGIIGSSYEREMFQQEDLSFSPMVGVGIDAVGTLKTVGSRVFKYYEVSDHWFNRCLLIFSDCQRAVSLSGYLHHSDGSSTSIKKSSEDLEYRNKAVWLSSLSVGSRSVIKNVWVVDFEISKRFLVSGGEVLQKKGASNFSERVHLENLRTAYGFGFSVGRKF
jgi:hypothetical protein